MSRATVAGRLPLLRDGRIVAELTEFELEGEHLEFTLGVPLPEHLLNELYRKLGTVAMPVPSSPLDGSLRVTWAHDCAEEVGLQLPARNSAIGRLQVRY